MTVPGPRARTWLFAAAAAALLSLGLPWGSTTGGGSVLPGYFTPGFCSTVYDYEGWASVECSSSYFFPTLYFHGAGGAIPGAAHPARALLAIAAVLLVVGYRRTDRRILLGGLLAGAVGFFAFGVQPAAGQLAFGLGVVCVALALRADGLLALPRPSPTVHRPDVRV